VNWRSTPISLPRSSAMTCCRVSRSLLVTRTASPWMLACALSLESLISANDFLGGFDEMPCLSLIFCRTDEFDAGSIFSYSRF